MKPIAIGGIVLIALGVLALIYQGISYTSEEHSAELGPVTVTAREKEQIPLPPIVGVLLLGSGIILLVKGWT